MDKATEDALARLRETLAPLRLSPEAMATIEDGVVRGRQLVAQLNDRCAAAQRSIDASERDIRTLRAMRSPTVPGVH